MLFIIVKFPFPTPFPVLFLPFPTPFPTPFPILLPTLLKLLLLLLPLFAANAEPAAARKSAKEVRVDFIGIPL
jgi:hypothetical protein